MKLWRHFWQHSTKFELLLALYLFLIFVSETLGFKLLSFGQIGSLPLNLSVAVFLLPFIYSINDIITEVYGIKKTLSLTRLSFTLIFFLGVFSLIFTSLPPSPRFAPFEAAYDTVFGFSIRASLASLTAFFLAQWTDVLIFQRLRSRLHSKSLWLRNNLSNLVALFIDTTVFITIARWNLDKNFVDNLFYLLGLILPYWGAKMLVSVLATPLVYWGVRWLKHSPVDHV